MGSKETVNEKGERLKMERTVLCNGEPLQYQLHYKKVKNVNIRVASDGVVQVSASRRSERRKWTGLFKRRPSGLPAQRRIMPAVLRNHRCPAFMRRENLCVF